MSRHESQRGTFSVGQLAARWGIGAARVRELVDRGALPAFRLPSVGRYACTIRIPREAVEQAELSWAVQPDVGGHRARSARFDDERPR